MVWSILRITWRATGQNMVYLFHQPFFCPKKSLSLTLSGCCHLFSACSWIESEKIVGSWGGLVNTCMLHIQVFMCSVIYAYAHSDSDLHTVYIFSPIHTIFTYIIIFGHVICNIYLHRYSHRNDQYSYGLHCGLAQPKIQEKNWGSSPAPTWQCQTQKFPLLLTWTHFPKPRVNKLQYVVPLAALDSGHPGAIGH